MALVSPGVEVTIIDESQYIPAATNSVPYILIATAQNKVSAAGVGVAPGTLAANANRVYLMTSQRDLAATFGNPFFYKTTAGTPINGYELNEYGLMIDLGDFLYVSLGWAFIILTAVVIVGAKVYNKIKNKENKVVEPYLHREDNSLWGTNE